MPSLIAMGHTAQQVDMPESLIKLFQSEDRIVRDSRRIVLDTVSGDVQMGQQPSGELIERMELLSPAYFSRHLPPAKVFRFPLQECDFIQPLGILQEEG